MHAYTHHPHLFQDGDFKKSSFSQPGGIINCLLVATKDGVTAIRNSKDSTKTTLYFTADEMTAFVAGAKAGEFDVK